MIAIVDSGVANLASVTAALRRLGAEAEVTADAKKIAAADRVILPGVGAAAAAMAKLREKNLVDVLRQLTRPVLGICLGLQVMFERSEEGGGAPGLGIFPGSIGALPAKKLPHMGWNQLKKHAPNHSLLRGVDEGAYVYFVHSFAAPVAPFTLASASYESDFTAMAALGNFMGCQFHPERSGIVGGRILKNFLEI